MNSVILEPPLYLADSHIFNIDFHPFNDIFCCCTISG